MVFTGARVGLVAMEANSHQDFQWVQVQQVRQWGAGSSPPFLAVSAVLTPQRAAVAFFLRYVYIVCFLSLWDTGDVVWLGASSECWSTALVLLVWVSPHRSTCGWDCKLQL